MGVWVVVMIVIGAEFWNKSASYHDIKTQILKFCGGSAKCEAALSENVDTCFDHSYDMGSRRRSGRLGQAAFVQCMSGQAVSEFPTLNH